MGLFFSFGLIYKFSFIIMSVCKVSKCQECSRLSLMFAYT